MTLNDLEWSLCVKIWSEVGIQWVGILAFGENCLEICRATHIAATKKISPARNCRPAGPLVILVLWGYSLALSEEEASNQ